MASLPTRRRYKFTNAPVVTTLAAAMTVSDGTFTITVPTNWPTASSENFWVTIGAGTSTEERILCSGTSGTTVTVASGGRGADGTSASAHNQGDSVWVSWSATDADEANAHVSSSASTSAINVHGLAVGSSVVGTTDTQTLTNKTLTSAKISGTSSGTTVIRGASAASGTVTIPAVTGTLISDADTGTVTSTMIADGTIVNADINASAAIDKTKISGTAITAGDTGTVTNTMLAGSIAASKITGTAAVLTANTFTATQTVTPTSGTGVAVNAAASGVGVVVKANATTPGDIAQFQDSSSNVITRVVSGGGIVAVEPIVSNTSVTGTVTLDCSTGTTFTLTVTGTGAVLAFTNLPNAGSTTLTLVITQGTGGSKTIAWGSTTINSSAVAPKWASGAAPTLSTSAGQVDIVTLVVNRSAGSTNNVFGFLSGKAFA